MIDQLAPDMSRPIARPSLPFVSYHSEFDVVTGPRPRLVRVVSTDAHEGPVYVAEEDALYFTSVPRGRETGFPQVAIERLQLKGLRFPPPAHRVTVVREAANGANGMALDLEGGLVVCEQGSLREPARITRVDRRTGRAETIVDAIDGMPFNSPNDVVVKRDGSIWFTDPSYGHLQGFRPRPWVADRVYRYDPATDEVTAVADPFDKPNGLAFSPDEKRLYVADNGAPHHLLAFDVDVDGNVGPGRVHAVGTREHPDGLKVDAEGRIYASASTGIQVFSPDGRLIGEIWLPGAVNFTFGGPDRNVLFITVDDSIWAAVLATKGA
jgi:gluconolactonase